MNEITITLNDEKETLRFTIGAWKAVGNYFGNFLEAFQKLAVFDPRAYIVIVAAGLGKKPADVEEAVARTDISTLTAPLTEYIDLLSRGGRPKKDEAEGAPKGEA